MLLGRHAERARIDALLAEARAGRSGSLVLRGEAGIGKTALCDYALEQAAEMSVLRARGVETESELPFAALLQLLRPALDHLPALPEPRRGALSGALALGPAVVGDRLTICAAVLSLLAAAGNRSPTLVLVDDAQWLDRSSVEALLFAARRLDFDRVALLFAVTEGYATLLDRADLPVHRVGPLETAAAAELLGRSTPVALDGEVAGRILSAAAGNPLVLVEVAAFLTPDQLSGAEPVTNELPTPPTVVRAFVRQLERLPDESREALVVASVSEPGEHDALADALARLGLDLRVLGPAEEAGVVVFDERGFRFRHPLLRAAVYRAAPEVARRAAHRALADAGGERSDARAWHLASAAPSDDAEAADALEGAAVRARERGGYAEAATAFERSAQLTEADDDAARRLRDGARDHWLVGRVDRARELLDTALERTNDPILRARVQHLRGSIEMWHGSATAAVELLVGEAERVTAVDPGRAAAMLTDAAWAAFIAADLELGLEAAGRACAVASKSGGGVEARAKAVRAIALTLGGEAKRALPLFADYQALVEGGEPAAGVYQPFRPDGQVLMWFEEYGRARDVLTRSVDSARAQSALGVLPWALTLLAELDFRTGRWIAAYAGASEAVRIADEMGQNTTLAFSLSVLARVEAAQGRAPDAISHADRAIELAQRGINAAVAFAASSLGLLELGRGRHGQAIVHLERVGLGIAERGLRETSVVQWTPDLIEAYVRAGRSTDAEALLERFELAAVQTERTWALATAARCRGLLSADAFEEHFLRALELHDRVPTPFERARTELCFGEQLRRSRQRVGARPRLAAALETFERLGAEPWAERARAELAATGETLRPREPLAQKELTPQELQVALVVARGATNKEAGAALFLSPKTIETHLGRVYRKLNVRSRTELARLLAGETAPAEVAA
jgi:DNA-binding CsgD family transcriptional regulator